MRKIPWRGLPFPYQRDLPNPGIETVSLESSALAGGFFTTVLPAKPQYHVGSSLIKGVLTFPLCGEHENVLLRDPAGQLPVFVNKLLSEYSPAHLLTYCLRLLSHSSRIQ